jgi:two-component system, cell cycle sensor histidine kinase and response regulator CckA
MKWIFGLKTSIVKRLTFYSVVLTASSLLLTGVATIYVSREMQKKDVLLGLEKTAQQVAVGIVSHLGKATTTLSVFADVHELTHLDHNGLNAALSRFLIQQRRLLNELVLVDVSGKEKARVSTFRIYQPSELLDRSSSVEFQVPSTGHNYVGPIHISKQSNVPVTVVAVPIRHPGGTVGGALLAEVPLREMWNIVSEIEFGQSGYVYVVDQAGRLVAFKELSEIYRLFGQDMVGIPEVKRFISRVPWDVNQDHQYRGLRGEEVIGSYAVVDHANWGVVVELPVVEAFAGVRHMIISLGVLLLAAVLITSITNPLLIKRVTADLDLLRQGAELIGKGNLKHQIDVRREDELGILAQVFNSMASQLRKMIDNLEQRMAERERAQVALREGEKRYRNLVESTLDWVWICDINGRGTFSNEAVEQLLGYKPDEVVGRISSELLHPEDQQRVEPWFRKAVEQKRGWKSSTMRWLHKDGSVRFLESTAQPIFDSHGQLVGFTGIDRDVTERKRAQDILQESEERFRHISELSPFGISLIEPNGRYIYLNRKFVEIFGYTLDDIPTGREWFRAAFPDQEYRREVISNWLSGIEQPSKREIKTMEYVVTCKDGTLRDVLFKAVTMKDERQFIVYEDLTERKRIEQELLRIQKLESVGILAGGIAHDFNNLLTGIIGNISLAMMDAAERNDKTYRWLKEAEKASARARELTQQLLTFSKGGAPVKKKASLRGVVVDSCEFILRGSNSRCEFAIENDLWLVEIDEGQISQVISNIIINAVQAMPEGGVVEVTANNYVLDASSELPLAPGRYVRISIQDEGVGIWKESLPKIFDPYFTTKQTGSGLGLATVYSVMTKHDGYITAESEPGSGAAFHLYLPAASDEAPIVEAEEVTETHTGKGKILLMDDEEIIWQVAGEMLAYFGYEVHFAKDGSKALELYKEAMEASQPFDLVIMDLTIPGGMGGKETISRLLEMDPEVRAIVSSGYFNDPVMADYSKHGFRGVVSKPYRMGELSDVIRKIFNGRS